MVSLYSNKIITKIVSKLVQLLSWKVFVSVKVIFNCLYTYVTPGREIKSQRAGFQTREQQAWKGDISMNLANILIVHAVMILLEIDVLAWTHMALGLTWLGSQVMNKQQRPIQKSWDMWDVIWESLLYVLLYFYLNFAKQVLKSWNPSQMKPCDFPVLLPLTLHQPGLEVSLIPVRGSGVI